MYSGQTTIFIVSYEPIILYFMKPPSSSIHTRSVTNQHTHLATNVNRVNALGYTFRVKFGQLHAFVVKVVRTRIHNAGYRLVIGIESHVIHITTVVY